MRSFNAVLLSGRGEGGDQRRVGGVGGVAAEDRTHNRIRLGGALHAPGGDEVAEVIVVVELAADRRLAGKADRGALLGDVAGDAGEIVVHALSDALTYYAAAAFGQLELIETKGQLGESVARLGAAGEAAVHPLAVEGTG